MGGVGAIAISLSDGRVFTGGNDRTIKEWDSQLKTNGKLISTERGRVENLVVSSDGKALVASSGQAGQGLIGDPLEIDHKVRVTLWNLEIGQSWQYVGHKVTAVAFSSSNRRIAWGNSVVDPSDYSGYYLNRGILEFELQLPGTNTPRDSSIDARREAKSPMKSECAPHL